MAAALPSPGIVGWSGILDRKTSSWFLNRSTCSEFILLNCSGSKLKSAVPLTPFDCSLACLTIVGADLTTFLGTIDLPLLLNLFYYLLLLSDFFSLQKLLMDSPIYKLKISWLYFLNCTFCPLPLL